MKFKNKLAQDVFDSCNEYTKEKIGELLKDVLEGKISGELFEMLMSIVNESNTQYRENVIAAAAVQNEQDRIERETSLGMASIYAAVENNS